MECSSIRRQNLGFRVYGLGFGVIGFRVEGVGFRVQGLESRVEVLIASYPTGRPSPSSSDCKGWK